jgi:hypothetical protein
MVRNVCGGRVVTKSVWGSVGIRTRTMHPRGQATIVHEREAGKAEGPVHGCVGDTLSAGMRGSQDFLTTNLGCRAKGLGARADAPVRAPVGEAGLFGVNVLGQGVGACMALAVANRLAR